jgi:hypothetical protein
VTLHAESLAPLVRTRGLRDDAVGGIMPSAAASQLVLLNECVIPKLGDQFITNDKAQENCLREIMSVAGLSTRIRSCDDFCNSFLVGASS